MPTSHPSFIVDAFTRKRFAGNPAAVCLIPKTLENEEYLRIAAEFNLSETAFPVPLDSSDFHNSSRFSLRWFTPKVEYPLCGHATLATSHVIFNEIGNPNDVLKFETRSGVLTVRRNDCGDVDMSFPKYELVSVKFDGSINPLQEVLPEVDAPSFLKDLVKCVVPESITVNSTFYSIKDSLLFIVLNAETTKKELEAIQVDGSRMLQIHNNGFVRGLALTISPRNAPNQGFTDSENQPFDYACRYFAPWCGVLEDPATGSAQCALAPFWSAVTGKREFYALQAFPSRGAQFRLRLEGDRVILKGSSVTVLRGEMTLD